MFFKKGVLKIFAKLTGQRLLFFDKLDLKGLLFFDRPEVCNFIKKETLVQVFSCEFCEISKNTFFHRIPLLAASETYKQES